MQVGSTLRAARERLGLSPEQIADRTKIQLQRVVALEADNVDELPQGIYLDGIIRAYSHEVAIDPEPLIADLHRDRERFLTEQVAASHELDAFGSEAALAQEEAPVPPPAPSTRIARFPLVIVLLLAIAGWGAYLYERNQEPDREPQARIVTTAPSRPSPDQQPSASIVSPPAPTASPTVELPAGMMSTPRSAPPAPKIAETATKESPATNTTAVPDVSGSWMLATHVESTSYTRFAGLNLGYRIELEQSGDRVKGSGHKVSENANEISSRARTPISIDGTIAGDRLMLNFTERGARRPTQGKFVLLVEDEATLRGRFSSTAARSAGTVEAHRARQ